MSVHVFEMATEDADALAMMAVLGHASMRDGTVDQQIAQKLRDMGTERCHRVLMAFLSACGGTKQ